MFNWFRVLSCAAVKTANCQSFERGPSSSSPGILKGKNKKFNKSGHFDQIRQVKQDIDINLLCEGLPDCFNEYIKYTRGLQNLL